MAHEVRVRVCEDCQKHAWCTRHNDSKYEDTFQEFKARAEEAVPGLRVTREAAFRGGVRVPPPIGSFEVSFQGVLIFSKLSSGAWPNQRRVIETIAAMIEDKGRGESLSKYAVSRAQSEDSESSFSRPRMQRALLSSAAPSRARPVSTKSNQFQKRRERELEVRGMKVVLEKEEECPMYMKIYGAKEYQTDVVESEEGRVIFNSKFPIRVHDSREVDFSLFAEEGTRLVGRGSVAEALLLGARGAVDIKLLQGGVKTATLTLRYRDSSVEPDDDASELDFEEEQQRNRQLEETEQEQLQINENLKEKLAAQTQKLREQNDRLRNVEIQSRKIEERLSENRKEWQEAREEAEAELNAEINAYNQQSSLLAVQTEVVKRHTSALAELQLSNSKLRELKSEEAKAREEKTNNMKKLIEVKERQTKQLSELKEAEAKLQQELKVLKEKLTNLGTEEHQAKQLKKELQKKRLELAEKHRLEQLGQQQEYKEHLRRREEEAQRRQRAEQQRIRVMEQIKKREEAERLKREEEERRRRQEEERRKKEEEERLRREEEERRKKEEEERREREEKEREIRRRKEQQQLALKKQQQARAKDLRQVLDLKAKIARLARTTLPYNVKLTGLRADLKEGDQFGGKIDPYLEVTATEFSGKTEVKAEAGKNPVWSKEFQFKVVDRKGIKFQVFDQDLTSNDFVGSALLAYDTFCEEKGDFKVKLKDKEKEAGMLLGKYENLPSVTVGSKQYNITNLRLKKQVAGVKLVFIDGKQTRHEAPFPLVLEGDAADTVMVVGEKEGRVVGATAFRLGHLLDGRGVAQFQGFTKALVPYNTFQVQFDDVQYAKSEPYDGPAETRLQHLLDEDPDDLIISKQINQASESAPPEVVVNVHSVSVKLVRSGEASVSLTVNGARLTTQSKRGSLLYFGKEFWVQGQFEQAGLSVCVDKKQYDYTVKRAEFKDSNLVPIDSGALKIGQLTFGSSVIPLAFKQQSIREREVKCRLADISATFKEGGELLGKIDPYLVVSTGRQKVQTEVVEEGGEKVQWKQELVIELAPEELVRLQAFDKDLTGSDFIGAIQVTPRLFFKNERSVFPLFDKQGKQTGQVSLSHFLFK